MGSYTMTVGELMDVYSNRRASSTKEKIEIGRQLLFDFDYPIFDEAYRKVFETHFIRKFYMREIGFETEGLFKFQLETWLTINMPYFNKMFESELIEFDPLQNEKMNITRKKESNKTQNDERESEVDSNTKGTNSATAKQDSNGTLTTDNFERKVESETPDSRLRLTANDGESVIEYASNIKEESENDKSTSASNTNESSSSATNVDSNATQNDTFNSTINDIEDYVESVTGKKGLQTYSSMLKEFRQTFLRIENQMFDEMQELFMQVY